MANQEAYQAAMREAASAAWDQNWDEAITHYQQAITMVPNDSQALAGLGLSLIEAGRHTDALQVYERLAQLVPNDPLPFEKLAEINETLNRSADAAKKYLAVAELYFARKDLAHAIPNWEHAAHLDPDLPQPHMRLGVAYEQSQDTRQLAIYEYLALARVLQQFNQLPKAEQALQRALQLDQMNQDVRGAVDDFRKGQKIQMVTAPGKPAPKLVQKVEQAAEELPGNEEIYRTPIEDAARYAMGLLADLVWSGEVPQAALEPLVKAIDDHQASIAESAIEHYSKALQAGLNHPALNFNLGLLYIYTNDFDRARPLLETASSSSEYGIAANLLLGQAYYTRKDPRKGAEHLMSSLQLADTTINDRVDTGGYVRVISGFAEQPDDYLRDVCKALSIYLDEAKWKDKIRDTLAGYAAQGKSNYVSDLLELVMEGGRPEIASIMERVDMFVARNMTRMALEETQYAIEKSPDYLPAHRRLADILAKEGRTQEASAKLNLVANTYLVRGNPEKAADLFTEVIELWPADMAARERVIEMLKDQGRVSDVIKQYSEMGDFFYRLMADPNRATEIYNEALTYAQKNAANAPELVNILKALADIESQQLNWNKALAYYQQVMEIAPDDQDTALSVVDLNFQTGNSEQAVSALDAFIRACITRGQTDKIVATLEEQIRKYPNEVAVRQRLAEVYRQQKRVPDAIAQMDSIGELLLDQGRIPEAVDTIKAIIEMNPPDLEGYTQLLAQLESR